MQNINMLYIALFVLVSSIAISGCSKQSSTDEILDDNVAMTNSESERGTPVKLSMVIHEEHRTELGLQQFSGLLEEHDITMTGKGLATVSARATAQALSEVFALSEAQIAELFASSKSSNSQIVVEVPDVLSEYCKSISIEPPAELLSQ